MSGAAAVPVLVAAAALQAGAAAGTGVDPSLVLAGFGLNIAAVIGAAWRVSSTLTRLDVTLSRNLEDVGKLQARVDRLEKDVNAMHRLRRMETT